MKHSLGATDTHRVRSECPMRCTSSRSDVRGRGNKLRSNGVLPLGVLVMAERHRNLSVRLVAERVADARLNVRVPSFWNRKRPSLVPVVGRSPSLARDPVPIRVRDESTATAQVQNPFRGGSTAFARVQNLSLGGSTASAQVQFMLEPRVDRLRAGSIHAPRPGDRLRAGSNRAPRRVDHLRADLNPFSRRVDRPLPTLDSCSATVGPYPSEVAFVFFDGRPVSAKR